MQNQAGKIGAYTEGEKFHTHSRKRTDKSASIFLRSADLDITIAAYNMDGKKQ